MALDSERINVQRRVPLGLLKEVGIDPLDFIGRHRASAQIEFEHQICQLTSVGQTLQERQKPGLKVGDSPRSGLPSVAAAC